MGECREGCDPSKKATTSGRERRGERRVRSTSFSEKRRGKRGHTTASLIPLQTLTSKLTRDRERGNFAQKSLHAEVKSNVVSIDL